MPPAHLPADAPPSPKRLEKHVRMLAETFVPRSSDHPETLSRVADYIHAHFKEAGARVKEQSYMARGSTYRNVLAYFGPETDERLIVGAHYDAAGPYPGADDNASAVAGLLELARMLSGAELPLTVELAAYPLEEPPYFLTAQMGSAVHARSLKESGVPVQAMLCLEMIGYFSDEPGSQRFPLPGLGFIYPSTGNFISVVGRWGRGQVRLVRRVREAMRKASPLPVHSINAPRLLPGIAFSDHFNYWRAGYDAVMITDTAFYRNPNYHTAADTPETLDYGRMAQVVEGVFAAAERLVR